MRWFGNRQGELKRPPDWTDSGGESFGQRVAEAYGAARGRVAHLREWFSLLDGPPAGPRFRMITWESGIGTCEACGREFNGKDAERKAQEHECRETPQEEGGPWVASF